MSVDSMLISPPPIENYTSYICSPSYQQFINIKKGYNYGV